MNSNDIAVIITNRLITASRNEIYLKRKDHYRYGIEIMITAIGGIITIAVVALLLGIEKSVLSYVFPFCLLRMGIGGKHASTHSKCMTYFIGIMLITIMLVRGMMQTNLLIWGASIIALYDLIVIFYKLFKYNEKINNIKLVGIVVALYLIGYLIYCCIVRVKIFEYLVIALVAIAIELTSALIKEKKENGKNNY